MLSAFFCTLLLNFVFSAPRTFNGSNFISEEAYYYANSTLECDSDADCLVRCNNRSTCENTTIICPESDNACLIYFYEESSQEEVLYSGFQSTIQGGGGDLTVNAYGSYGFNNGTVYCPDNKTCTISCSLTSMNETYTTGPCAYTTILGGMNSSLEVHAETKWSWSYSRFMEMFDMLRVDIYTHTDESIINSYLNFNGAQELYISPMNETSVIDNNTMTFSTTGIPMASTTGIPMASTTVVAILNISNVTLITTTGVPIPIENVTLMTTTNVPLSTTGIPIPVNLTNRTTEVVSAHIRDSVIYGGNMTYFHTSCYNCMIDSLHGNWISVKGDNFERSTLYCPLRTGEYRKNCIINTTNGYLNFRSIYSVRGTLNLQVFLDRDQCFLDSNTTVNDTAVNTTTVNTTQNMLPECNMTIPLYCILNTTSSSNQTTNFNAMCDMRYYEEREAYLCTSNESTNANYSSCGMYEFIGSFGNVTDIDGRQTETTSVIDVIEDNDGKKNKNMKRKLIIIIPVIVGLLICCLCCCYFIVGQLNKSKNKNKGECNNTDHGNQNVGESKKLIPYV